MTLTIVKEPEDVLVEFLRYKMTDPRSRLQDNAQVFSGDGSTTVFTLSTVPVGNLVMAIVSVLVNSVVQKKYVDYDYSLKNGTITFDVAPGNGIGITVNYKYGTDGFVYVLEPLFDLTTNVSSNYPRVNVWKTGEDSVNIGGEGNVNIPPLTALIFRVEIFFRNIRSVFTVSSRLMTTFELVRFIGRGVVNSLRDSGSEMYPMLKDIDILDSKLESFDRDGQFYKFVIVLKANSESSFTNV